MKNDKKSTRLEMLEKVQNKVVNSTLGRKISLIR